MSTVASGLDLGQILPSIKYVVVDHEGVPQNWGVCLPADFDAQATEPGERTVVARADWEWRMWTQGAGPPPPPIGWRWDFAAKEWREDA